MRPLRGRRAEIEEHFERNQVAALSEYYIMLQMGVMANMSCTGSVLVIFADLTEMTGTCPRKRRLSIPNTWSAWRLYTYFL